MSAYAAPRYFAPRYFAPRYYGVGAAAVVVPPVAPLTAYARTHARTLAKLRAKGQRIVFTKHARTKNVDGTLGALVTTTMSGYALGLEKGDPATYAKLNLAFSAAPTVMVACDTYGDAPPDLATCVFGGFPHMVKDVLPFAPDGIAIFSTCVLSR